MDLINKNYESEHWIEIRPLITSVLETANFAPILDVLYNFGQPFKFVITDTTQKNVEDRCLVKFFLQFQNNEIKNQITNIIRALLDVELISETPVEKQYEHTLYLELSKHYALPIINYQEKTQVNLIDRLTACLAGSNSRVEIIAQANPNAATNIQKFIYKKTNRNSTLSKTFLDQSIDFIGQATNQALNPSNKTENKRKTEPYTQEYLKNVQTKFISRLFTCNITIKSSTLQQAQAIKNTLPSNMNHFKPFKHKKDTDKQTTTAVNRTLNKPTKYLWRNNILCQLWWILPLSIILFANIIGVFNPIKIIQTKLCIDLLPLTLAIFLSISLFIAFKKRQPIILSTQELAQITGLPTATTKLPVALGKIPISRMQLGTNKQKTNTNTNPNKNNKQIQTTNKPKTLTLTTK
ncbi:MAG: hypothetical protein FWH37_06085 [Candidatus Bathyarchaeota archaeon]|nr:hypothetical protein [Candidatus Termiticorpusculum sp.]